MFYRNIDISWSCVRINFIYITMRIQETFVLQTLTYESPLQLSHALLKVLCVTLVWALRSCGHFSLCGNFGGFVHCLSKHHLHDTAIKLRTEQKNSSSLQRQGQLKLSEKSCEKLNPAFCTVLSECAHLFVHEDVDERVVDAGALREKRRNGDKSIVFVFICGVGKVKSCQGVRAIAGDEGPHHNDDHSWHLLLRLLGGGWLSLLGCNLQRKQQG